jgi:hypothetical protein
MRSRIVSLIAVTALMAALAWSTAPSAGAMGGTPRVATTRRHALRPPLTHLEVLYDQNDHDTGVGIVSQDFTDLGGEFDVYDSGGADDFVIPSGETWTVQALAVTGTYFNGIGPADAEQARFYEDAGGLPGTILATISDLHGTDNNGSFDIPLGEDELVLSAGTYWVGVRIDMPFATGQGEWGWVTRSAQSNSAAAWRNSGDGFATGCRRFHPMQQCVEGLGEGPDFMFAVEGLRS